MHENGKGSDDNMRVGSWGFITDRIRRFQAHIPIQTKTSLF